VVHNRSLGEAWTSVHLWGRTELIQARKITAGVMRSGERVAAISPRGRGITGSIGDGWLTMAKPARQVAGELRSHLSQFRHLEPKK